MVLRRHSIGMAEADDGYTYAQKVRTVRTVALGDPTLVKLEYISNEDRGRFQGTKAWVWRQRRAKSAE